MMHYWLDIEPNDTKKSFFPGGASMSINYYTKEGSYRFDTKVKPIDRLRFATTKDEALQIVVEGLIGVKPSKRAIVNQEVKSISMIQSYDGKIISLRVDR